MVGRRSAEAMEDISLHILDIAENSIRADAKCISVTVVRDGKNDLLRIEVIDDGKGMDAETLAKVRDPFFTTKHKKTGLGIPLLTQAAEQTGGTLVIESEPGTGTRVLVTFGLSHMDRPAIGNMAETLITLIAGHADRDYVYEEREGEYSFRFDTRELKAELEDVPINTPAALAAIKGMLQDEMKLKR
jgi:anti-sigma regulatory factor (Ser/Thr protein kinase)